MEKHIGKTVKVSDDNDVWVARTLLAVLPDDIKFKYIVRNLEDTVYVSSYKYARPIKEETYYYQYERLVGQEITISNYMTDKFASYNYYTKENDWYKIESSKRTWEH